MGEGTKAYEMKKLLVFVLMFGIILSSNAQRKNAASSNSGGGAVAGAAVGVVGAIAVAAYYENQMREMVEQSAMEWALMNKEYDNGDKLEMKLIEWEVKALSDISSTSNLLFKYRKNNEPYEVIMFILSKGWWNDNGVIFSKIQPITIDKTLWDDIMRSFIDVAAQGEALQYQNNSIHIDTAFDVSVLQGKRYKYLGIFKKEITSDLSSMVKLKNYKLLFEIIENDKKYECSIALIDLKNDEHIIGILDNPNLILDYNENRINLFNKSTRDLIKLSLPAVNEIHRLLYREPFWFDAI